MSALTRSGDGVQDVRAAAGTGETFALDAAPEAWQRSGVPVLGCELDTVLEARMLADSRAEQLALDGAARRSHSRDRGRGPER